MTLPTAAEPGLALAMFTSSTCRHMWPWGTSCGRRCHTWAGRRLGGQPSHHQSSFMLGHRHKASAVAPVMQRQEQTKDLLSHV
jgi:hypothetical protein